ncbi:glycosyltransferase [Flavobacterium wongokense]|uniref:glycosyltransferase n=1 Tax=Flavobacterium wongokense TaxID=2910674 RepID=UPI001F329518|nr:glycosyltransferase [Flavobacterium sp. WG47]MCF6130692.1 glycosyltransferase [Flavobacterium sp. WG47]
MKNNNKIAIVSASLGIGGAERFAGLLSLMLQDLGYEVHHIIILDHVDYEYKGTLVNLGKLFANEKGVFRALKKGKYIAKYLSENEIQTVIDNRSRPVFIREVFTKWIYGNRKTYFMIHSYNLEMYFSKFSLGAGYLYKEAAKLVCVSKDIENRIQAKYNLDNTTTIHNPVAFPETTYQLPNLIPKNYILFFGRFEEEIKNFTLMLNSFKLSKVYSKGTMLLLIGDGSDKDWIQAKIKELQLESFVLVLPFQKNITAFVQNAKSTILTSHFEGFPMSIVESLAAGTPVISVDCESGPQEIIRNNHNGLLVPNYNEAALAQAISNMVFDEDLHQTCKNNAQKSVEHLSLTNIAKQWEHLLAQN